MLLFFRLFLIIVVNFDNVKSVHRLPFYTVLALQATRPFLTLASSNHISTYSHTDVNAMASELPEGGLYFQIKKEDLANAPPGVTEFLLKLTSQNSDKTGCQDRREAVTGLAQSNSLSERLEFLTGTLQMLAEQPELPETIHDTPWADFVNKIDILIAAVENFRTWQNGDPTNLPIDVSLQGCESKQAGELDIQPEVQTESDSSKPGEALSFDHDVVIVDAVEAADKHNQNLKPVTHKRLPNRCQDNELVTDVSQACALQGTSSAPINVELLPAEDASLRMPIPDFCGSDSDILENLVQFGMKNWPQKTFDYFRPGKHATAGILNDLLRTNLPVQFALGVPPHRVNNLEETFAGIVMPFHVNETNQISNIESEKNHFVIAIVDKQNKTFTSWGMSRIMHQESQVAYEEALGIRLAGIRNKVRNLKTFSDRLLIALARRLYWQLLCLSMCRGHAVLLQSRDNNTK